VLLVIAFHAQTVDKIDPALMPIPSLLGHQFIWCLFLCELAIGSADEIGSMLRPLVPSVDPVPPSPAPKPL
jgi:hypothetical protein